MKQINYVKIFLFLSALVFNANVVWAQTNPDDLTCEELGFVLSPDKCGEAAVIKCPFDLNKAICEEAFVGEIKIFSGKEENIPIGWLKTDGRSLSTATYRELYAVLGTTFGGYGGNFNLPDFSGKFPLGVSSNYSLASKGGEETHTLSTAEMPSHSHGYTGVVGIGFPDGSGDSINAGHGESYPRHTQDNYQGGSQPHNNMPPYLSSFYIIFSGVYL